MHTIQALVTRCEFHYLKPQFCMAEFQSDPLLSLKLKTNRSTFKFGAHSTIIVYSMEYITGYCKQSRK